MKTKTHTKTERDKKSLKKGRFRDLHFPDPSPWLNGVRVRLPRHESRMRIHVSPSPVLTSLWISFSLYLYLVYFISFFFCLFFCFFFLLSFFVFVFFPLVYVFFSFFISSCLLSNLIVILFFLFIYSFFILLYLHFLIFYSFS